MMNNAGGTVFGLQPFTIIIDELSGRKN